MPRGASPSLEDSGEAPRPVEIELAELEALLRLLGVGATVFPLADMGRFRANCRFRSTDLPRPGAGTIDSSLH